VPGKHGRKGREVAAVKADRVVNGIYVKGGTKRRTEWIKNSRSKGKTTETSQLTRKNHSTG